MRGFLENKLNLYKKFRCSYWQEYEVDYQLQLPLSASLAAARHQIGFLGDNLSRHELRELDLDLLGTNETALSVI